MPQNAETYLRNLHTRATRCADAWDALHASDDPKVVEQRLRSVKGLTDNTEAIGDASAHRHKARLLLRI
jgi:hypothetical protein